MAVSWNYNGSGTITATLDDAVAGDKYRLVGFDDTSTPDVQTAASTTLVLTITGVSATYHFQVVVTHGNTTTVTDSSPCVDSNIFTPGVASTTGTGYDATFAYDAALQTLSVTFTATAGSSYYAAVDTGSGFQSHAAGPLSAGSHTITMTGGVDFTTPAGGRRFWGILAQSDAPGNTLAARVFVGGTTGAGTAGTPPAAPEAPAPVGRVLIAFDDGPLAASPTWTRIDDTDNLVSLIEARSGKQTELDRTDTGTATVTLNDTQGLFDPLNTLSPYFGNIDGKQILIQIWNPVALEWVPRWRGKINDYGYDADPSQRVVRIQINCVDVFDYLAGFQVKPGVSGKTAPVGAEGTVHYYGGTDPRNNQPVDDRIIEALADASVDTSRSVVFSGNVDVQPTNYDPGDPILNVLRDAADAEFPGISNIYVDRFGRFVFHGRYARFDPDAVISGGPVSTTTWDFHHWKVGDGAAIALDSDRAQMRVLSFNRGPEDIVNSAIAWPRGVAETAIAGQVFEDATSKDDFGQHSLPPMGDLIIAAGTTTGNTALVETKKFAEFFVHYRKTPRTRITALTVKAVAPDDPRAEAVWTLLCKADISDIANVKVGYPNGVGFDAEDHYVEGVTVRIKPLQPIESGGYDYVEIDLDLTPTAWGMDPDAVLA